MIECRSPELQDLLPDYAADALDSVSSALVSEHLATCAHCADDLTVLRIVRQARPRVAVPDIARIVAALPPAPNRANAGFAGPRLVRDEPPTPGMQRTRPRGVVFGLSAWRLAATLGVVIAGGASVLVARRGIVDVHPPAERVSIAPTESSPVNAVAPASMETLAVATPTSAAHAVSVSYGDLGDYTEAELESMLARLDQWDGATNTEPLPGVPMLPNPGGGTP